MRPTTQTPTSQINNWRESHAIDLPHLFMQFDPPPAEKNGTSGNTNFSQQFSRLVGIDFGIAKKGEGFHEFVKMANINELSMVLAATGRASQGGEFSLYFKTVGSLPNKSQQTNFYQPNDEVSSPLIYDILPAPLRTVESRLGVSANLRNQFVYNWQVCPSSVIGDLFYGKTVPQPVLTNVLNTGLAGFAFPRYNALVRAEKYRVTGQNLETLKKSIPDDFDVNVSVYLAMNTSDLFVSKDLFTLIIDIKPRYPLLPQVGIKQVPPSSKPKLTPHPSFPVECEIDLGSGNPRLQLTTTLTENGVEVSLKNGSKEASIPRGSVAFNQQLDISLKDAEIDIQNFNGNIIIWVDPRFVNIRIEQKNDSGQVLGAAGKKLVIGEVTDVGPNTVEQTFGDSTYLEFVQACPPFCGGG